MGYYIIKIRVFIEGGRSPPLPSIPTGPLLGGEAPLTLPTNRTFTRVSLKGGGEAPLPSLPTGPLLGFH